ncbi:MAG: c-type cytochrome [Bacteroidia bacterium]
MNIIKLLHKTAATLTVILLLTSGLFAQSADEGKELYNANCTACHAINEKVVGPALKDVHKRRDEAWLVKWIKNSQAMVKAGDPVAVQVYKENNEALMTSFENLSDNQIKSIIAYIKQESETPAKSATAGVDATAAAGTMSSVEPSRNLVLQINWLLIIIGILLIMVISITFNILNRVGDIQGRPVINWTSVNSKLLLGFLIIGMGAAIWEFVVHGKLTYFDQDPAAEHGKIIDDMFMITLVLTGVVFIITQILLFWYGYKYKHSEKRKALFFADNHKLEYAWTLVPAIVLTVLVIRGLIVWNKIMYPKNENAINIEVFGYQFGWNARYAGNDNTLGKHDFRQVGKTNALGVLPDDENAKDDIITNELYLPVGVPVNFAFRAKDVIHSAYFPHFRSQMNVVPGLPTKFSFTPTITTAEMRSRKNDPKFDYILLCNKICGGAHYRMKMKVVVVSESEYKNWLKGQKTVAEISQPIKDNSANTENGKEIALKNNN